MLIIPGDPLSEGAQQRDVERRCELDDHLDRQGRVPVLRGDGPCEEPRHARTSRPLASCKFSSCTIVLVRHICIMLLYE